MHFAELVVFCVALSCFFIKLGVGEIESHDEALSAVRALAAVKFGAWLDQSAFSLGGLYSATHPPLGIWLIALSRAIFGESEFATRLPSALAGAAATLGMYKLLKQDVEARTALLSASAFSVCTLLLWYGRHAQLESLVLAFSIWTIVIYRRALDTGLARHAVLAGSLMGLALMSKFIWALFILPFMVFLAFDRADLRHARMLSTAIATALVVALPWHVYMLSTHAHFLQHVRDSLFGLTTVEHYEPGGGRSIIYYLNQLLVNCPFIVSAIWIPFHRELRTNRMILMTLGWLALLLLVLQLASTKMPHFALVLLPAGYLLSALVISTLKQPSKTLWLLLGLAVMWSLSLQLRMIVRGAEFVLIPPDLIAVAVCFAVLIGLVLVAHNRGIQASAIALLALTGVFVMTSAAKILSYREEVFSDGAKRVVQTLQQRPVITELTVLHTSLPHGEQTPRLAYYTYGWTQGWVPGKTSTKIAWDNDDVFARLGQLATESSAVVVERDWDRFYKPPTNVVMRMDSIKALLYTMYSRYDSLRSYDLYYN